jgi:hypothetical protein
MQYFARFLASRRRGDFGLMRTLFFARKLFLGQRSPTQSCGLMLCLHVVQTEILKMIIDAGGKVNSATDGVYEGHAKPVRRSPLMWYVHGEELLPKHQITRAFTRRSPRHYPDFEFSSIFIGLDVGCDSPNLKAQTENLLCSRCWGIHAENIVL